MLEEQRAFGAARPRRFNQDGRVPQRMLQDSLSEGLRLVRTQRGLTREELARQARGYGLRWHGTTVTEIEAGRRHLRLEQLLLLALALDASPADFVAGDEPVHLTADARVGVRTVRELLAGRLDDDAPRDVL